VLDDRQRMLGFTLLVEAQFNNNGGRVLELGADRKPRWSIENIPFPVDAWVLGENRVLIAEYNGRKVTERDFKGSVLWQKDGLNGTVLNAQRLPNGHTFIALQNEVMEVDREGKAVFSKAIPGGVAAAAKGRDGVIVCLTNNNQCLRMAADGKELNAFPSNRGGGWTSGIDLLPNGNILISQPNEQMVTEVNPEGKSMWTAKAPGVTSATHLPDGHVLVAGQGTKTVTELDREGKTVWEFKNDFGVFRARRR
jgi:hypothetical protein